ncbi:MAG: Gfo/Idh/MocA family oxidoreductase [Trueperaceae bacterium]|nr:Gfo/Idh/MocA family oxidoreductase [Trueperaceae bacterium]
MSGARPPTDAPLRVALVGAGFMGAFHADTLARLPGASLTVVVDASLDAATRAAAPVPGARAGTALDDAFGDDVDAVVLATPAATHPALIERAATAGQAIFCEKPLATDLADAERARDAVHAAGVPFQIGFQRRYDRGIARLLSAARDGSLGTLETFRSTTFDPYGPDYATMASAAGIFHDTLSHDVDLALATFGPVAEVFTRAASVLDPRFEDLGKPDTISLSLRFANGALGTIDDRLRSGYGYETSLEVAGSRGKGVVRDDRLDGFVLHHEGRTETDFVPWFLERFETAYRAELEAFVGAVRDGRPPDPGIDHALAVLRVCLAAERAYLEDRRVRVDPGPDDGRPT